MVRVNPICGATTAQRTKVRRNARRTTGWVRKLAYRTPSTHPSSSLGKLKWQSAIRSPAVMEALTTRKFMLTHSIQLSLLVIGKILSAKVKLMS
jgi:hypothetical protein